MNSLWKQLVVKCNKSLVFQGRHCGDKTASVDKLSHQIFYIQPGLNKHRFHDWSQRARAWVIWMRCQFMSDIIIFSRTKSAPLFKKSLLPVADRPADHVTWRHCSGNFQRANFLGNEMLLKTQSSYTVAANSVVSSFTNLKMLADIVKNAAVNSMPMQIWLGMVTEYAFF